MKVLRYSAVALFAALFCASFALAQEGDPAMDEMMKKWMEAGTPGPQHAMLAAYAGEWAVETKWWKDPQAEPEVSGGTATLEMILGGRYMSLTFKGDWNGQPWTGIGYLAYENMSKRFQGTWIDEMSTGLYFSQGTADESGKVLTMLGKSSDPASGEIDKPTKEVWTFGDNTIGFVMFDKVGTDAEFKAMEINYIRK